MLQAAYTYDANGNRTTLTYANGVVESYQYNKANWITSLVNSKDGTTLSSYAYTYYASGNEENPSASDVNPFRYCGEYYDTVTGLYYLRARYYDPTVGRFTQEDTHWNTANMIYGDNPQKINEREDALGLKAYSYVPQISAVMQSGNLYVYCLNNPVWHIDPTGDLAWPGEIHNAVEKHIAAKYHLHREQIISYSTPIVKRGRIQLFGRADLISASGEVWDVKRDRKNQIAGGVIQVRTYVENVWFNHPKTRLSVGGRIPAGSFVYKSAETTYYVWYRYAGGGVIAYDYDTITDWNQVAEMTVTAILLAGTIILISATGGATAPVLIPLLA